MSTLAPLHFAGERLMLDPAGALLWPARRLMAVADLHLEKATAAAARGSLLPPWDSHATLESLALLMRRHAPDIVVAVGDSFHDVGGAARLAPPDAERLAALTAAARFVWVEGNHDPAPPEGVGGESCPEWREGPLVFRHQAEAGASGEISGHFHPKARLTLRGESLSRPCFLADARRVLLPALGAYTGGLDIRDGAIAALFPRGGRAFLLGRERLFSFAYGALRAARAE